MPKKTEQDAGERPCIHLVDDDPSYLESTARLLRLSGYQVLAFRSPTAFLEQLPADASGCVVTDLRMPEMDGLTLQHELQQKNSLLSIIFLTAYGTLPSSVMAMRHGAVDFLAKDAPHEQLIAAIERALEHNAELIEQARAKHRLLARLERLTPRERQVLALVAQGWLNKQIAAELGIHERTVKLHRASGMHKMETDSVAALSVVWHQLEEHGAFSPSEGSPCPKGQ